MGRQIDAELSLFEEYLRGQFDGKRGGRFERQAAARLLASGGKRLRPRMLIASAFCGKYERDKVFAAAGAVEMLHTASLVHDDIVDRAEVRRGIPTISAQDGVFAAVYTGDWLLATALLMLAESGINQKPAAQLAIGVRAMCAGEIEQFLSRKNTPTVSQYLKRVMRKTGMLFAASCAVGGHLAGLPEASARRLGYYGLHFGTAFQIRDDLLDVEEHEAQTGKTVGRDREDGVITLPWILPDGVNGARRFLERYREKCYGGLKKLEASEGRDELTRLTEWL